MAIVARNAGELLYLVDEQIPVPHAFTTRFGGVSGGIYASLNLGMHLDDDPAAVSENYDRIMAALGAGKENLVISRQVHGNAVRVVGRADAEGDFFAPGTTPEADGLVTAERDVTLAVFTADCIPILLWTEGARTGAVGAVHAGWRSTVLDIVGKAIGKMTGLGADPGAIRAAIGPGISGCCFETGPEVPAAIDRVLGDVGARPYKLDSEGKYMVDLKEVNRRLLIRAGVSPERVTVAAACTMCQPETFWSHRVTKGVRGTQAAIIQCTANHGSNL